MCFYVSSFPCRPATVTFFWTALPRLAGYSAFAFLPTLSFSSSSLSTAFILFLSCSKWLPVMLTAGHPDSWLNFISYCSLTQILSWVRLVLSLLFLYIIRKNKGLEGKKLKLFIMKTYKHTRPMQKVSSHVI